VEGVGAVFEEPASAATPSPSRCLHVASVAPSCTEEYLYLVFSPFGDVEALKYALGGSLWASCCRVAGLFQCVVCFLGLYARVSFECLARHMAAGKCGWAHMYMRLRECV
jgi:hypothetical protein